MRRLRPCSQPRLGVEGQIEKVRPCLCRCRFPDLSAGQTPGPTNVRRRIRYRSPSEEACAPLRLSSLSLAPTLSDLSTDLHSDTDTNLLLFCILRFDCPRI